MGQKNIQRNNGQNVSKFGKNINLYILRTQERTSCLNTKKHHTEGPYKETFENQRNSRKGL